jgi:hypothetical protein
MVSPIQTFTSITVPDAASPTRELESDIAGRKGRTAASPPDPRDVWGKIPDAGINPHLARRQRLGP